jgi:hypothetical protein
MKELGRGQTVLWKSLYGKKQASYKRWQESKRKAGLIFLYPLYKSHSRYAGEL